MKLTWKDHEEIAWALMDKFPDQDPLKLSFPKLHQMVLDPLLSFFGLHGCQEFERFWKNLQEFN